MSSIDVAERELPLIQRGIIDTCFEEGHYEYGIDVLDKLRGQRYKPTALHIHQLLYISLYPPPPKPPKRIDSPDAPPPSPQKVQLQRHKDDLWPDPRSRPLAIALLEAFANTNFPEGLMRGLPFYPYVDNDGVIDVDPFRDEKVTVERAEDNSTIKNEIMVFRELKDCWELLRAGLVKRKQVDRLRADEVAVNLQTEDDGVVGPYAWPVLEWLIHLFEKDERRTIEKGQAAHSALLLCQIPPPKTKKGPRWDAEAPLRVACACFHPVFRIFDRPRKHASSETRFDLGMRLIVLLLNLTSTKPPLLSPPHFLRSLALRLRSLPLTSLRHLLSAIPPCQTSFKVSLLESYISHGKSSNGDKTQANGTSTGPAPRAKPKFNGKSSSKEASSTPVVSTSSQDKEAYPIPTRDSLITLLASPLPSTSGPDSHDFPSASPPPPSSATPKIALAKFHLVSALCALHLSGRLADPRWASAAREGKLRKCIVDGFAIPDKQQIRKDMAIADVTRQAMDVDEQEIQGYMTGALEMMTLWEASCG